MSSVRATRYSNPNALLSSIQQECDNPKSITNGPYLNGDHNLYKPEIWIYHIQSKNLRISMAHPYSTGVCITSYGDMDTDPSQYHDEGIPNYNRSYEIHRTISDGGWNSNIRYTYKHPVQEGNPIHERTARMMCIESFDSSF